MSRYLGAGTVRRSGLILLPLGVLFLGATQISAAEDPAKRVGARSDVLGALEIESPHREFGIAHQAGVVEQQFLVTNRGQATVRITEKIALAGDAEVSGPEVVEAGASATITVRQSLGARLGKQAMRYALITDEPGVARYRFSLSGFVESAFDPEAVTLDFGATLVGVPASATASLGSREVAQLDLIELVEAPAWLHLAWKRSGPQEFELSASAVDPPVGLFAGDFVLRTNVPNQPLAYGTARGSAYADVVPEQNPISVQAAVGQFGPAGSVLLRSRSGRTLAIRDITSNTTVLSASAEACPEPTSAACARIVVFVAALSGGPVIGQLTVHFDAGEPPLPLRVAGVAVRDPGMIRRIEGAVP